MASAGPRIPSTVTEKRKRADEDEGNAEDISSSDSETGPAPPGGTTDPIVKKPRVIGPSLPPTSQTIEATADAHGDTESSSEDDDFGPSLPPKDSQASKSALPTFIAGPQMPAAPATASKRDDWMMVPPSGGDWSARVDPTKLKNRKFNTGKGSKGPATSGTDASNSWHETPQEKQARLQREMMGIKDATVKPTTSEQSTKKIDLETAKRLEDFKKSRGLSLYATHQAGQTTEQDDDPSARAFDREKDIGGGLQINATQRRDMVKKAADFGSRFSSARYL